MSKIREALAKARALRERALAENAPRIDQFGRLTKAPVEANAARFDVDADTSTAAVERFVEVDRDALSRAGLLVPENVDRRLSDQYREIKRPLLDNAGNRNGLNVPRANLVMITSAVPGEGKTFTCVNLSLSLAREADWRVLLVDGDVAKGHLTSLLGLTGEVGLLDLLRNPNMAIEEAIVGSDIQGVSFLPSGKPDQHATELLASNRMGSVMAALQAQPGTIVLFDSPPLLLTTESAALASHMGQVVVVVKAGHTTQQQVQGAIAKLEPEKAVSLILNQAGAEGSSKADQYGSGYGYYGYGAQEQTGAGAHEAP